MKQSEIFQGLLETAAKDLGLTCPSLVSLISDASPVALKTWRDDLLSGLLSECGTESTRPVQDLLFAEFFAKAKAVIPGFEPETSLHSFVHGQYCPEPLHARDRDLKNFQSLLKRIIGGPVNVETLVRAMRHGPGATATGVMSVDKWLFMEPAFGHCLHDAMDPLGRLTVTNSRKGNIGVMASKYMDVPKTLWKNRGICAEEAWLQFVQQGIGRILARRLRGFTDISKQWRNIEAAMQPGWSTLDLSAASDSITVDHMSMEWWNPDLWDRQLSASDSVEILSLMWIYRSRWVSVPIPHAGESRSLMELNSFATMGNGFCFPLLTASCIAITLMAICETFRLSPQTTPLPRLRQLFKEHAAVYGDDIVVSPVIHNRVRYYLSVMGFRLNSSKSSEPNSRLKETCGAFILDGKVYNDLLRIRDCTYSDCNSLVSMADLQRRAYMRNWRRTASFINQAFQDREVLGSVGAMLWTTLDPNAGMCDPHALDSTLVGFSSSPTAQYQSAPNRKNRPWYQGTVVEGWTLNTPKRALLLGDGVAWAQSLWSDHLSAITAEPDQTASASYVRKKIRTHF